MNGNNTELLQVISYAQTIDSLNAKVFTIIINYYYFYPLALFSNTSSTNCLENCNCEYHNNYTFHYTQPSQNTYSDPILPIIMIIIFFSSAENNNSNSTSVIVGVSVAVVVLISMIIAVVTVVTLKYLHATGSLSHYKDRCQIAIHRKLYPPVRYSTSSPNNRLHVVNTAYNDVKPVTNTGVPSYDQIVNTAYNDVKRFTLPPPSSVNKGPPEMYDDIQPNRTASCGQDIVYDDMQPSPISTTPHYYDTIK